MRLSIEYTTDFNKALQVGNKQLRTSLIDEIQAHTGKDTFIQGSRIGYAVTPTSAQYVKAVTIR